MKSTFVKILLSLYAPAGDQGPSLSLDQINLAVPELNQKSLKNSLALLTQKHWITRSIPAISSAGQKHQLFSMTFLGSEAIRAQFPVFQAMNKTSTDKWSLVLFSTPPKGDPGFRYLRRRLIESGAYQLDRGLYAFNQPIPQAINSTLMQMYKLNIYLCEVANWNYAFKDPRIYTIQATEELNIMLSGLSNAVNSLLIKVGDKNRLTNYDKKTLATLYDQLAEFLHLFAKKFTTKNDLETRLDNLVKQLQSVLNIIGF